jgi:hypothetical protein
MEIMTFKQGMMCTYLRIEDTKISYLDIFIHYCKDHILHGKLETGKHFTCFSGPNFMVLLAGPQDYPMQLTAGKRIHSLKSDHQKNECALIDGAIDG